MMFSVFRISDRLGERKRSGTRTAHSDEEDEHSDQSNLKVKGGEGDWLHREMDNRAITLGGINCGHMRGLLRGLFTY